MGFGSPLSESLRANPTESDHETGLSTRSVTGATRSDGSASADSPSASVSCSSVFAHAVNSPTLYLALASCTPRSHNSCNKVDASDVRASRRLVRTLSRERRTFSLRDLCLWRSPSCGECHRPNLLSENVKRSREKVRTSLRDVRRRVLETPRASQELGVESFRSAIGMPFVSDVQETHTVSMAASMSTAVQSGAAPPRAPRTSAEGHGVRGSSCLWVS